MRASSVAPRLTEYMPAAARVRPAAEVASDLERLRLLLETSVGDRYRVEVSEGEIRLRRRA